MAEVTKLKRQFAAGIDVLLQLLIPRLAADPSGGGLVEGMLWYNTTTKLYKGYANAAVIAFGATTGTVLEALFDANTIIAADTDNTPTARTVGVDTIVGRLTGGNIKALSIAEVRTLIGVNKTFIDTLGVDAATLGGDSKATLTTNITAAILNGAPGTLDTLLELAAALGNDPSFATTIATALGLRGRIYAVDLAGGSPTEVITHGYTLAQRGDFIARVFVKATGVTEEYRTDGTSTTQITVTDETGGNIPAGRRIFVVVGA